MNIFSVKLTRQADSKHPDSHHIRSEGAQGKAGDLEELHSERNAYDRYTEHQADRGVYQREFETAEDEPAYIQ